MKQLIKKMSKQNIGAVRLELARAHLIIALLSFIAIILFTVGSAFPTPIELNTTLSTVASLLLVAVIVTSTVSAYALLTIINKK